MGVVIDTCVWIDMERGRLQPADITRVVGLDSIFLTPMILAEYQYGVERTVSVAQRAKAFIALVSSWLRSKYKAAPPGTGCMISGSPSWRCNMAMPF